MKRKKKNRNRKLPINPNLIIDKTFHPLFKKNKSYVIIDGILHFIVEQNPPESTKKFIKYSLKHL